MAKKKTFDDVADYLAEHYPNEIEELFEYVVEQHCDNCPCKNNCKENKDDKSKSIDKN